MIQETDIILQVQLKLDIVCKCFLEKINKKQEKKIKIEHYIKDNVLIIDLEMQKGFKEDYNDERFLKYAKILAGTYADSKIMVLLLVITSTALSPMKYKGSEILFQKQFYDNNRNNKNYRNISYYEDCLIYQIDLNYFNMLISKEKRNEELFILENNYFENKGKEWIKFLTISIWCESFSDGFYVLPPVDEKFFYNELIFKAIQILKIHDLAYKKVE